MKLLIISTVALEKNGISTCIMNYYRTIDKTNMQIDIVAPNIVSNDIKNEFKKNSSSLFELTMRKSNPLKYFFELTKIVKRGHYDIVHAHGNSCTLAIELTAALIGGCKIRIAHSHNTTCEHKKVHYLLRPLFDYACTDNFACGEEAGKWLYGNKPFSVIKNGINLEEYIFNRETRNLYRKKLGVSNEVLLGHIGVFNYQKNHEFLIKSFVELLKQESNIKYKLLLIGDGELLPEVRALVKDADIESSVIFTGKVNNVSDYLQAIDLFLLPSRFEGLPYVLVEAQASCLPCLVSDKVSSEAKLTELVHFIEINQTEKWVQYILKYGKIRKEESSEFTSSIKTAITNQGFNLTYSSKKMLQLYENKIKGI